MNIYKTYQEIVVVDWCCDSLCYVEVVINFFVKQSENCVRLLIKWDGENNGYKIV